MITWLDMHSGAVIAVLTFALVTATMVYAALTWKAVKEAQRQRGVAEATVQEMKRQRFDAVLPIVVVSWGEVQNVPRGNAMRRTVKPSFRNCGLGTALDVCVKVCALEAGEEKAVTSARDAMRPGDSGGTSDLEFTGELESISAHAEYVDVYGRTIKSIHRSGGGAAFGLYVDGQPYVTSNLRVC